MRFILLLSAVIAALVSCERSSPTPAVDCGCDSPVSTTLSGESAIVEYYEANKDFSRLFIKNGSQYTFALLPCSQNSLGDNFKKNGLKVKVSGQVRKSCSDTDRQIGIPFTLTAIEIDSNRVE